MISSHILEDKWKVQKALSEQAGYDPRRYLALVHKSADEAQERYGIQFRYVEVDQGDQVGAASVTSVPEDNARR